MISISATIALALVLALVLTRLMIVIAPKMGMVDIPDARRIHEVVTPRGGGVAVWAAFLLTGAFVLTFFPGEGAFDWKWYRAFALASSLLVLIGIIDDRHGMPAPVKLAGQVLVAILLFFAKDSGMGTLLGHTVPWWVDLGVWVIWTVGIINAFNLIDGMDGLCAGLATISLGALAIISFLGGNTVDGLIMIGLVGALLGFLRYNFHPARIFLGDTGSMFIGLAIASAATTSAGERAVAVSILLPLLVAGIPLFDVVLAVWRRSARRFLGGLGVGKAAKVFGADREHLHHRLLDLGLTQRKVAGLLYALALAATVLAMVPSIFDERALGITVSAVFVAGLLGLRYLAPVELHTSGKVLDMVLKRPPAGRLISLAYFGYDTLVIVVALIAALTLNAGGFSWTWEWGEELSALFSITLACGLLGLVMSKAHQRLWARAGIRDFWALGIAFAVGLQVAFTLMTLVLDDLAWSLARIYLLTGMIAFVLFMLPRSFTSLIREAVIDSHHRRLGRSRGIRKRIVLYGAGDLGELFLSHLKTTRPLQLDEMRIVGYLDDQPNLKGRVLDGFPVFGSVEKLPSLKAKFDLHGVVITTSFLRPEQAERLSHFVAEHDLTLYRWCPHLQFTEIESQEILDEPEEGKAAR